MLEIILLVAALSIDSFIASLAYGADKIKIPILSALALSGMSSLILILSMGLGGIIGNFLPINITKGVCFAILILLGISRFTEGVIKDFLKRRSNKVEGIAFKFWNFHFILDVYMDNTKADVDHSKVLSVKEALSLGIVLSLDGIAAGFGNGLISVNYMETFLISMGIGLVAILWGGFMGKKIAQKTQWDISWLSGITLIILAFMKMI